MPTARLYMVCKSGPEDHYLILAENVEQAIELWRNRTSSVEANPDWVFLIPEEQLLCRKPRVFSWHGELPCVFPNT